MIKKLEKYFIAFLIISCIGWCYEVILQVVFQGIGFHNKGVLFGPICPIYGFGGMLLYFCLRGLRKKKGHIGKLPITPIVIFVGSFVIATLVELAGSYIAEAVMGKRLWNYDDYFMNFEGRIALETSCRFAIGGVVIIYILMPLMDKFTNKVSKKIMNIIAGILLVLLLADMYYTFVIGR